MIWGHFNVGDYKGYTPTIGIECHVQLSTKTKLFSGANNDARGKEPNTTVSPICFGLPGTLPFLNKEALSLAIRAGIALNAEIAEVSSFDRKHYFYPDLPKGYQITQLERPTVGKGSIDVPLPDGTSIKVRITRAHLEEDAGKLMHPLGSDYSLVDLNRAGTPLVEIVSEPDMHSPLEAKAYVQELYLLMKYARVSDADLYHGNMRFDVNVSVAKNGSNKLGTRAEVKNLNSFRSVEKATEYEIKRQIELLEKGEEIIQETRGWNEAKQKTVSQRSKEHAHDYRYFPDADIPPVEISHSEINAVKKTIPMLPPAYREAWKNLKLDSSVIIALLASQTSAKAVIQVQTQAGDETARRVAHWFASAVSANLEDENIQAKEMPVNIEYFVELSMMVEKAEISSTSAKEIFNEMLKTSNSPREIAEFKNLLQISDDSAVIEIVEAVLADPASQKAIEDIKNGNERAIGYLVGQVMQRSKGQANPALATKLLRERL